ncbi:hypothetical protein NDU88_006145 [Pleurodeles waltl]|uniref:Uncharacterized protein n=1 Tax=Pleurodeles waltl TaxID=8319 RepID=A0AAV7N1H1_PLEWA|nr:hypothetical protein NDU88_006145 [Pleurodeles waltl]
MRGSRATEGSRDERSWHRRGEPCERRLQRLAVLLEEQAAGSGGPRTHQTPSRGGHPPALSWGDVRESDTRKIRCRRADTRGK